MSVTIPVRTLVSNTYDQIWTIGRMDKYSVVFDDTTAVMTGAQIQYSWYYWELHRVYPGAPIYSSHALLGYLETGSHPEIAKCIFWDVVNTHLPTNPDMVWEASELMMRLSSGIYNAASQKLTRYMTSACAHDFMEILKHPEVKAAKERFKRVIIEANYNESVVQEEIDAVHEVLIRLLFDDKTQMMSNGIKQLCIANNLSQRSLLQMVGIRGYPADVSGRPFPYPIETGYFEGLNNIYDIATESRSASRAMNMNTKPLTDSEYHNRQMQLFTMSIMGVENDECVGYKTVPWIVDEGQENLLKGKFHMLEDGSKEMIWGSIDHLVGKTIKLRSITRCGNENTQTVCKTCLGWTHHIIPRTKTRQANLGYMLVGEPQEKKSQSMLGTKHWESSAISMYLQMNTLLSTYFQLSKSDESEVLFNKKLARLPIVRIANENVRNLNNILSADISELSPSRTTTFKHLIFIDPKTMEFDQLDVTVADSGAHLSSDALEYLKEYGWETNSQYIEFRLDHWDIKKPFIVTPKRSDNIYLFHKAMVGFVVPKRDVHAANNDDRTGVTSLRTVSAALYEFVKILTSRVDINIVQAEVYIRACMTVDCDNGDFRLPHPSQPYKFSNATRCLFKRNLPTALAYEEQDAVILDPHWFTGKPGSVHPLDPIVYNDIEYPS